MGVVIWHGGQTQSWGRREFFKTALRGTLQQPGEFISQLISSAVKPGLHGLCGTFQNLADLGVGEFLVFRKNERGTEFHGQFTHGLADGFRSLRALQGFAGCRPLFWHVLTEVFARCFVLGVQ